MQALILTICMTLAALMGIPLSALAAIPSAVRHGRIAR
jgi:hypothetical protein